MRAGAGSGNVQFNRFYTGGELFGGVYTSTMLIEEIAI
jgi:hypothetical protein